MARPLKVGILLPCVEGMYRGGNASWPEMTDLARAAEDAGFDSLWTGDHFLYRFPGIPEMGTWEAWSLITGLAAVTERVELGTMVSVTPWRTPGLLAKIVTAAEEISVGRIILGLGAGSHESEFPAFGYDSWGDKIARFEEELPVVKTLLRDGRIDHDGKYHTLRDCEIRPRGPRAEGPPIMVGAVGPRMIRLAATHADEWNIPWKHRVEDVLEETAKGEEACREVGRDPATLRRSVCAQVNVPGQESTLSEVLRGSRVEALRGDPAEIAAVLRSYADAGVSHVQLWLDPTTVTGIEAFAPVLEQLDRAKT